MRLHLIENKELEETQVTVAYREKDEPVKKIIAFVEHLEESATDWWEALTEKSIL